MVKVKASHLAAELMKHPDALIEVTDEAMEASPKSPLLLCLTNAALDDAPWQDIEAARVRLEGELKRVQEALAHLESFAPRCPCGEIGEPYCATHEGADERLEKACEAWLSFPDRTTATAYALAHMTCGLPGTCLEKCYFPGCKATPEVHSMAFCSAHDALVILKGGVMHASRGRKRG